MIGTVLVLVQLVGMVVAGWALLVLFVNVTR